MMKISLRRSSGESGSHDAPLGERKRTSKRKERRKKGKEKKAGKKRKRNVKRRCQMK